MKNKKDDRQGFGELAESIYFLVLPLLCIASLLVLPLLCIASLMRGCGAKSARIPETEQQTVSEQQHVTEESGETDPAGTTDPKEAGEEVQVFETDGSPDGADTETAAATETPVRSVAERKNPYDPDKFSYTAGREL